jgi:hypothetical protein
MRTTIDIDDPILKELKALQRKAGQSLGRLVSDLLAQALRSHKANAKRPPAPEWISKPMHARVDLSDKDAVYEAMEQPGSARRAARR